MLKKPLTLNSHILYAQNNKKRADENTACIFQLIFSTSTVFFNLTTFLHIACDLHLWEVREP